MSTFSQICLDLSVPLHIRLEHIRHLTDIEVDNLLECMCSVYNIHPTFLAGQYVQYLILQDSVCLKRRIRIAEACDMGCTVLYLLTRIQDTQQRISCIEMFDNPFLKMHAYAVLFTHADPELSVQIMKNLYRLTQCKTACLQWFSDQLSKDDLQYTLRANCADFLLRHSEDKQQRQQAKVFLRIENQVQKSELYFHPESAHLLVPRVWVLEKIFEECKLPEETEHIVRFVQDNHYNCELFRTRILNDKTILASKKVKCTLEELLCAVWPQLSEDLRHLLIQDFDSSAVVDDPTYSAWACTTGYYNRLINIYQCVQEEGLFDDFQDIEAFQENFIEKLNRQLLSTPQTDDLLVSLSESSEAQRIEYLTFRIHSLPKVIEEMRAEYPDLSVDQFEEWISESLRLYEH